MPIAYAVAADHSDRLERLVVSKAPLPGVTPSPPLLLPPLLNARLWHLAFNQLPAEVNEALVRGREGVFFGAEFDASARRTHHRTWRRGRGAQGAVAVLVPRLSPGTGCAPAGRPSHRRGWWSLDPAGGQSDEEQHIQPPQPDGVDREEVAGEDAGRLLAQERPPGRGRRSRRRVQSMTT
jgi:hypothetical protein